MATTEGAYQDIEVKGKLVSSGWRSCADRWQIIKPHIKNHQTIMDVGSHYGYFSIKIAREFPDSLVWSIEETQKRSVIQKQALKENKLNNIVLSRYSVNLLNMLKLQRTCESLDTIMALSVVHYFPLKQIPEIIWCFSRLAQNLIIEFPSVEEDDVANKNLVDLLEPEYLLGLMYDSVIKIGESPSPKHPNIMRPIYLAQNYKITRENCMSYWNSHSGGHRTVQYENLNWKIDGGAKKYNGLNLANLRHFNVVYPNKNRWFKEAATRYYNLIQDAKGNITDIHPRNLIVSHNGVFPIDYTESVGKSVYDLSWTTYRKRIMKLSEKEIATGLLALYSTDSLLPIGGSK
jgi:hypothetical protein